MDRLDRADDLDRRRVLEWLDLTRALAPLTTESMSSTEWARVGTTSALWLGVPFLVGLWRISRDEVR